MDKESLAEQRDIMYMKTDELKAFNLDNLISKDSKNKIVHFNKFYYFHRDVVILLESIQASLVILIVRNLFKE